MNIIHDSRRLLCEARRLAAAVTSQLPYQYLMNREGTGAIEFALVLPILLLLYIGGLDVCLAMAAHKKMQHAASVVSDLITRGTSVTSAEIDGMFHLSNAIMKPRAERLSSIKVSGIQIDGNGKATIAWSKASGTSSDSKGGTFTLPGSFAAMKNAFLVRTETGYDYTPLGGFGLMKPISMNEVALTVPRVSSMVSCSDCN